MILNLEYVLFTHDMTLAFLLFSDEEYRKLEHIIGRSRGYSRTFVLPLFSCLTLEAARFAVSLSG